MSTNAMLMLLDDLREVRIKIFCVGPGWAMYGDPLATLGAPEKINAAQ